MVLSLNVKQGVWDENIYGESLVKGFGYECQRVRNFEEKNMKMEKSWWW